MSQAPFVNALRNRRIVDDIRAGLPTGAVADTFGLSVSQVNRVVAAVVADAGLMREGEESAPDVDGLVDVSPGSLPDRPCVYVVREEGQPFVKIGLTSTRLFSSRLSGLQNGNPRRLRLQRLVLGDARTEAELHAQFADYRVGGEWFLVDGALAAWLGSRCPDLTSV